MDTTLVPTELHATASEVMSAVAASMPIESAFHAEPVYPEIGAPVVPTLLPTAGEPELPPILVADDDPDDTYFVQRLIKKTGAPNKVLTFDDGTELVNYLDRVRQAQAGRKRHAPMLIFLDLKMAGLNGFQFLEWARKQPELAPLTIVVLTNSSEPEDMTRALELGAHRYLVKYPSLATFTTIVRSVYPTSLTVN